MLNVLKAGLSVDGPPDAVGVLALVPRVLLPVALQVDVSVVNLVVICRVREITMWGSSEQVECFFTVTCS